jgi:hypothetical protein
LKCTLCYQAHCGHCSRSLRFNDYLWSDDCLHCGMSTCPQFTRRPIIVQPTTVWPPRGHTLLMHTSADRRVYGQAAGGAMTTSLAFQCSCCGGLCESSTYCYLSWHDYDYPRIGHYGSRDNDMKVSRPVRRPGYLCRECENDIGVWYQQRNECEWAASTVAFTRGRDATGHWNTVWWRCKCRGQPTERYY